MVRVLHQKISHLTPFLIHRGGYGSASVSQSYYEAMPHRPCLPQGLISMMVQLFYAWRIRVLTKNYWVVALVCLTSAVSGCEYPLFLPSVPEPTLREVSAIGTAIGVSIVRSFTRFLELDVSLILYPSDEFYSDCKGRSSRSHGLSRVLCAMSS